MRNYIINIHRFYHYYFPNSYDHAIMPVIVFSMTINLIGYIVDVTLFDSLIFIYLQSLHKYMVTVPGYSTFLIVYLWYRARTPSVSELKDVSKGRWLGVIVCGISMIVALVLSIR